ncbi:substrate-binding domain-containing protein [Halorientalis salina]|uniref:substrate-binding domain-containing protein n=1 Tax=Halorientalis salina TaxID=2932266 RepID=UPI0010AD4563|nr:substrate-binding domain-containing protein [Halorientalis salina]
MARNTSNQSRRRFMKQTAGAGTLAGLAGVAGCLQGEASGNSTSMGSIANLQNSYWLSWEKGYLEAAEALGYDTSVQTNDGNVTTQQEQFDTAIANNTDTIVGQTYTNAASISLAETCVSAGVPTILAVTLADWYTPQDAGDEYVQFFAPHFVNHAYTAAKILFESMGGEGGFVHIEGNRGTAPNIGRNKGVDLAMEEYPDIEMLGDRIQGNYIRSDSRDAMADKVSQYGDDIEGYFGQNDAVAIGGQTVLEENGIDVPIVGIDAGEPGLARIEEGTLTASVSGMGPWQAGWSLVKCHDFLNGHELQPAERMMAFNAPVCVKDPEEWTDVIDTLPVVDAAEYNELIFEDETPYDWEKMSVAESGEDAWDPQIDLQPMSLDDLKEVLDWKEADRPDGYSMADAYTDDAAQQEISQLYTDRFNNNPLKQ